MTVRPGRSVRAVDKSTIISSLPGIASSYGKHRNAELAFNLVKKLNGYTKFVISALRGHCNVAGFNQIASYLYGFPFGLDFARGYPRYNPGEYTAVDVLRERDVDAAFILSAGLVSHFSCPMRRVSGQDSRGLHRHCTLSYYYDLRRCHTG